jgi:hypothetical protein
MGTTSEEAVNESENAVSGWRCTKCGNLTRFDVEVTAKTRAYYHFTVGGSLEIEDAEVLEERIDFVRCRWCGAEGDAIER